MFNFKLFFLLKKSPNKIGGFLRTKKLLTFVPRGTKLKKRGYKTVNLSFFVHF